MLEITRAALDHREALSATAETGFGPKFALAENLSAEANTTSMSTVTALLRAKSNTRKICKEHNECGKYRLDALTSVEETIEEVEITIKRDTGHYSGVLDAVNAVPASIKKIMEVQTVIRAVFSAIEAGVSGNNTVIRHLVASANETFPSEISSVSNKEYRAEFNMDSESVDTTNGRTTVTGLLVAIAALLVVTGGAVVYLLVKRGGREKVALQSWHMRPGSPSPDTHLNFPRDAIATARLRPDPYN
ncbi:hypothetical protein ERJ75_001759500 [Trypanosoma vivax]|nr:hypothetical protein ERJ75_001759500 [Trypanosoma vivax]